MIELFEHDIQDTGIKSSKGNQLKWKTKGTWYKADYTGYEGLVEYLVSHLLLKSSLKQEEFVIYDLEEIKYKRQIYNGVKSEDFLKEDWQIITLERLFQTYYGRSLSEAIWHIPDHKERFLFLTRQVEQMTGLKAYDVYLNKLFTIDALFLNEDRHTHNMAVLMNHAGEFRYCPIFDQGAGLLADTTLDYPLGENILDLMGDVEAKSISIDFDEQLDLSEEVCGNHLQFSFSVDDVESLLKNAEIYSEEIRDRVFHIMRHQMRKYQYLFW